MNIDLLYRWAVAYAVRHPDRSLCVVYHTRRLALADLARRRKTTSRRANGFGPTDGPRANVNCAIVRGTTSEATL